MIFFFLSGCHSLASHRELLSMEKLYLPSGKSTFCSHEQQSCLLWPGICCPRWVFAWAHPVWTQACSHNVLHGSQIPSTGSPCAPQCDGALILYSLTRFRLFAATYSSMKLPFRIRKRLHKSPSWDSTLQFLKAYLYRACNFYIVLANISGHGCSIYENQEDPSL